MPLPQEDLIVNISEPSSLSSSGEILSMSSMENPIKRIGNSLPNDWMEYLNTSALDTCQGGLITYESNMMVYYQGSNMIQ